MNFGQAENSNGGIDQAQALGYPPLPENNITSGMVGGLSSIQEDPIQNESIESDVSVELKDFISLLGQKDFSDVTLIVGGVERRW